jgi:hypothetical protein
VRELRELLGRRVDGGPPRAHAPALPAPERESA